MIPLAWSKPHSPPTTTSLYSVMSWSREPSFPVQFRSTSASAPASDSMEGRLPASLLPVVHLRTLSTSSAATGAFSSPLSSLRSPSVASSLLSLLALARLDGVEEREGRQRGEEKRREVRRAEDHETELPGRRFK